VISENVGSAGHPDFNWRKKVPNGPLFSLVASLRERKIGKRAINAKSNIELITNVNAEALSLINNNGVIVFSSYDVKHQSPMNLDDLFF
jgi:hypothetical protein